MRPKVYALERYTPTVEEDPQAILATPPPRSDLVLFGAGNSGESTVLRCQALALGDGRPISAVGLNNDGLGPRALTVRLADGAQRQIGLSERFVIAGDNPRDRLLDHPLLEERYRLLLRGVPVLETYPRPGYGGNGAPAISALDIDLNVAELVAFCRSVIRRVRGDGAGPAGQSDMRRIAAERRQAEAERRRLLRVAVVGGGSGSMGNATHHLLPYLLRHILQELGVSEFEIWGFVLGPQAFTGLTPFTAHNYTALIHSLEHLARHGQRRAYIGGLRIESAAPPYDQLFLLDNPSLPGNGVRVSEGEIEQFFDQAALTMYLLLACGTVWPTIASHMANPADAVADGRLRFLSSARAAIANIDHGRLQATLAAQIEAGALARLADALAT